MKQYQFSLKDECMKELPEYGRRNYQQKSKQPLSIPVLKNNLSFFIDGKVYNEDELEICKYQGETFAVSIPKQKVDDTEIFKDDLKVSMDRYLRDYGSSDKIINDAIDYILPELQKHYTITRK